MKIVTDEESGQPVRISGFHRENEEKPDNKGPDPDRFESLYRTAADSGRMEAEERFWPFVVVEEIWEQARKGWIEDT